MSSIKLFKDGEFTCPDCGCHYFGSFKGFHTGRMMSACNGFYDNGALCGFKWERPDLEPKPDKDTPHQQEEGNE